MALFGDNTHAHTDKTHITHGGQGSRTKLKVKFRGIKLSQSRPVETDGTEAFRGWMGTNARGNVPTNSRRDGR